MVYLNIYIFTQTLSSWKKVNDFLKCNISTYVGVGWGGLGWGGMGWGEVRWGEVIKITKWSLRTKLPMRLFSGNMIEKMVVTCGTKIEVTPWVEILRQQISQSYHSASCKPQSLKVFFLTFNDMWFNLPVCKVTA